MMLRRLTIFACLFGVFSMLSTSVVAQVRRPLPVVQRVEPTSGPPGTSVSLVGRHFDDAQTIWLGDTQLEVSQRLPSRWAVVIPQGASSGRIEVRTTRGNVRGPRFRVSQAAPAPVVSGFSPRSGAGGTEVRITGDHFSPRLMENHVYLGNLPVVVRGANPTELRVLVPENAQSGSFRVEVTGAGETMSEAAFTVGSGTAVASFAPLLGPPRTQVTLTGIGFSRNRNRNRVYLGDVRARVLRASETELRVEVPRNGAQSGRWLVDVRGGGRAYSDQSFTVRFAPVIRTVSPASGAPGTRVTLGGEHFGTDVRQVQARIGGTELILRDLSEEALTVEIPAGARSGTISVSVYELGPAETREAFEVLLPVAVAGFTPRSGNAGTVVTLQGQGFAADVGANHVQLGDSACEVIAATAESLQVRVPEAPSGPLVVRVDNAGESRTAQPFVLTHSPTIASFEPTTAAPGDVITIRGTNYGTRSGLIQVRLGESRLRVVRASETEIYAALPQDASTGTLTVVVRLQGRATSESELVVQPSQ